MVSYIAKLAALVAILPAIFAAPTAAPVHHLKIRNPEATNVVSNSWIVVYNDNVNATAAAGHIQSVEGLMSKRDVAKKFKGVGAKWTLSSFRGYQITADASTINEIANSPEVAYVEKDGIVTASALTTQTGAPWGLGRISHKAKGSTSYLYDTKAGSGVTVYVIDTGIYTGHSQFGGRASFGANFVDSSNTDGNGHGTHCAGTIAGSTYGVAKAAKVVAVKVLGSKGTGSNSGVISGIQWVGNNARARSVLSMSVGGSKSAATNAAIKSVVAKGVTAVVAAGNENKDAANFSPASEPSAITVGATEKNDKRAPFSNYGSSVDIFAPGTTILSSWIGSTTASKSLSGTSMATPHVAGLSAYLIALEGLSSPAAVANRLRALATTGVVTNPGAGSPNKLAYNGSGN